MIFSNVESCGQTVLTFLVILDLGYLSWVFILGIYLGYLSWVFILGISSAIVTCTVEHSYQISEQCQNPRDQIVEVWSIIALLCMKSVKLILPIFTYSCINSTSFLFSSFLFSAFLMSSISLSSWLSSLILSTFFFFTV